MIRKGLVHAYHDITPSLCHYISEWHSPVSVLLAAGCGWVSRWSIRMFKVKFMNGNRGMDISVG